MAAAMEGAHGRPGRLAAFGCCFESCSLYILLTIDSTIESLQEVDQIARALALSCDSISRDIVTNPALAGLLLDPAGKIIDGLSAGQQRIEALLPGLMAQYSALARAQDCGDGQLELVSFAYERCIESFTQLIDTANKARQVIRAHQNPDSCAAPDDTVHSNAA